MNALGALIADAGLWPVLLVLLALWGLEMWASGRLRRTRRHPAPLRAGARTALRR